MRLINPLFCTAPATMNNKATVSMPSLENPLNASSTVKIPDSSNITNTEKMTMSGRATSKISTANMASNIIRRNIISNDIGYQIPLVTLLQENKNTSSLTREV